MVTSYILVDGIRVGARLEGLPLRLLKIERYPMPTATPEQPPVWTTVEFEFEEGDAERVAAALSEVISEQGGWYTNFTLHDDIRDLRRPDLPLPPRRSCGSGRSGGLRAICRRA